jgi:MinD superfamily P-loop ATPase
MSLKGRIARLETEYAKSCQDCREVRPAIHAVYPGEEEPDPGYCAGCGRSRWTNIRVVYEDAQEGEG